MQSSATVPVWTQLLPIVVFIIIIIVRSIRPMRVSVTRLWVTPIVLCGFAALVIYTNAATNPAPVWEVGLGLIVGAIAGVPFGYLRGLHTDVRPTDRKGVMYLGSSWITIAVFAVAFGLRFAVRAFAPQHGSATGAIGDGLLAFAIAFIVTSYVMIYRKYEGLTSA